MSYSIQVNETSLDVTYDTCSVSRYNLTCNVVRMTRTNSSLGTSDTPVTIVTCMPCSIDWKQGTESKKRSKDTAAIDGVLHCRKPVGVTILTSDLILYGDKYYNIVFVNDVGNLGVLLEIGIKRES